MADNLVIESPDFDAIRKKAGSATEDAIKLLWYALNTEISDRRKQRFRWVDAAYANITFSTNGGTWTVGSGDFSFYRTAQFSDTYYVAFRFDTTTTSAGMGTELRFTLPSGIVATGNSFTGKGFATGAITEGFSVLSNASGVLSLVRNSGVAWPSGATDTLNVRGAILLQVV